MFTRVCLVSSVFITLKVDGVHLAIADIATSVQAFAQDNLKDVAVNGLDLILATSHLLKSLLNDFSGLRLAGFKVVASTTATAVVALSDIEFVHLFKGDVRVKGVDELRVPDVVGSHMRGATGNVYSSLPSSRT